MFKIGALLLLASLVVALGSSGALAQLATPRGTYPKALSGRFAPRQDLPEWLRVPRWYTTDAPLWGKGETAALVNELADHHATAFRLGTMWGGRAFFHSTVAPWGPSVQADVDPLAEAMATAKQRGIHVLAYINPNALWDDHPLRDEMCLRDEQGQLWDMRAYGREGRSYVCVNNPAFLRFYTAALREIFTRYDPDGLYVDGLTPHVCYCQHCREKFRRDTGRDFPEALPGVRPWGVLWEMTSDWDLVGDPAEPDIELYSRWQMKCLTDVTRTFTETVRSIKPDAVSVYHTWPKPDTMQFYDATLNEIYARQPWHFTLWKRAEFANWGDAFEVPSLVNIYLRQQAWKDEAEQPITSETQARHLYWQTLAQGGFPNAWAMPGMREPFAVMRDHADCFDFPTTFPVRFLAFMRGMFQDARVRKIGETASVPLVPGTQARLRILEREPGGKIDLLCLRADGKAPTDEEYRAGTRSDAVIYISAREYDPVATKLQGDGPRWERHDDPAALSGGYVTSVDHGQDVSQTHLDYVLPEVKSPGPWVLWARVIFPDEGHDSFRWQVSNDGGQTWLPPAPSDECAVGWEQPQEYRWVKATVQPSARTGDTDRFLSPYAGMYAGLLHARLPIKEIHPNHLTAQSLEGFRVLVLANEACLSDEQCELIERFVADGGALIATHETSLYDLQARPRGEFGLRKALGVSFQAKLPPTDGQRIVAMGGGMMTGALPADGLANHEEHLIVRPAGARAAARLVGAGVPGDGVPAVLANEYGRGRVVYLAGRSDSSYSYWRGTETPPYNSGDKAFPELIRAAVEWACRGEVPVRVESEGPVSVTLFEQPSRGRWLVHLVNFNAPWAEPFEQLQPVQNVRITIRPPAGRGVGEVRAVLSGADLAPRTEAGGVTCTLPRLDEYEIITFRWSR